MAEKKTAKKPTKKQAPKATKQEAVLATAKQPAVISTKFTSKSHVVFGLFSLVYLAALVWWEWVILSSTVWCPPIVKSNVISDPVFSPAPSSCWGYIWLTLVPIALLALAIANMLALRKIAWRKLVTWLNVVVVVVAAAAWQVNYQYNRDYSNNLNIYSSNSAMAAPPSLANSMQQIRACSDSISGISDYTYSTKYFYDLKQQGYHLAATLSQQAGNGGDFTADDCAKYLSIRSVYPANHIVLQLYEKDKDGDPLPYQYKDFDGSKCYFNDTTNRTVCPDAPSYGIFVKN